MNDITFIVKNLSNELKKEKEANKKLLKACQAALQWHKSDKWRTGTKGEQKRWKEHNDILEQIINETKG